MTDRRNALGTLVAALTIAAVSPSRSWSKGRPPEVDAWLRGVRDAKAAVQAGSISVRVWQAEMERLNSAVDVAALSAALDIDALVRRFAYDSALAETVDPVLPSEIIGAAGMSRWFVRVFGLRRGGAIIPHVHNNMVSSHLVIAGRFRARTHDRIEDLPKRDAVRLRLTRDASLGVGGVITMSDLRDNQHWLVAEADRSMTLDVGVVGLAASRAYGLRANDYNMIFVDPTGPTESDGTVVAPTLTFDEARAKFAA